MKELLDRTVRQTVKEEDGQLLVQTYQDVEPHLEYAAKCRREEWERRGQFGKRGEFRRTMTIPTNVLYAVAQRLGIPQGKIFESDYNRRIMQELKRSEFKLFRVTNDKRL